MIRKLVSIPVALAVAAICCCAASSDSLALAGGDLFYNYYVPPSGGGSLGAALYVSPRPTPPLVGHTYVTYPPLMPHEFLYSHHRTYLTQHPDGSMTRTHVSWKPSLFNFKHDRSPLPSPRLPHGPHAMAPWHQYR